MKYLKFFALGILFGIALSKAEVISWFRIYEMFKLQSFHMYGVILSAVLIGVVFMYLFRTEKIKDFQGNPIHVRAKKSGKYRNILGGIIFGMGWALAGACPGPMFILVGKGAWSILIVLLGANLGAFLYGILRSKLPH
ncbi:MAG TPA: YeeE/YedE family protein [Saprospiraceae bacterium]|nr:YeeE/YedE family protein [Saprospiraceae bacterium]